MSPVNSLVSLVTQKLTQLLPASIALNIGTEIIDEILNLEEEALKELLKLLGIGNNVDITA